jgi:hypothetical protein
MRYTVNAAPLRGYDGEVPMKPRMFVGSSSLKAPYAGELKNQLRSRADVMPWNRGFFQINTSYLASLINGLKKADFAAFVFAPDDILQIKGEKHEAIRDNVLFEFGLALGILGEERAFFLVPKVQGKLRLPSDLSGISTIQFDSKQRNLKTALGPTCRKIGKQIDKHGVRQARFAPPQIEIIQSPKVLCACSPWYYTTFKKDIELIRSQTRKMSAEITEAHSIDSTKLYKTLLGKKFDIIHIAAYVHPRTGDVCFGDLNGEGGTVSDERADPITAAAFSRLVELAGCVGYVRLSSFGGQVGENYKHDRRYGFDFLQRHPSVGAGIVYVPIQRNFSLKRV